MPFVWMRFFLYLLLGVGIIAYYVIIFLIIGSLATGSIGAFIGLVAIIIGIAIYAAFSRYINYLVKAAHIAVISELAVTGTMPQGVSVVKYGQEQVKRRFVASSVFYGLDGLIAGAVKQIQAIISKIGGVFGNVQAVQNIVSIINMFVGIVLGYVDEAVLARIFIRKDESAWKGAADGVVLYFQNWKEILKNAVGIVIFIIVFYVVGTFVFWMILSGLFSMFFTESSFLVTLIAIISACLIMLSLKESFVDSWITISVVNKYMQVSYNQQPQFDLYNKAKGWSKKFANLCSKAEAEGASVGVAPVAVAAGGVATNAMPQQPMMNQQMMPQQQPTMNQPVQQQPMMGQPMNTAPMAQQPATYQPSQNNNNPMQ